MASLFQTLMGLFTKRRASIRATEGTVSSMSHEATFRSDMIHVHSFDVNISGAISQLEDMRHESFFSTDMTHSSTFGSDLTHVIEIDQRG